jgi:rubredoxin
MDDPRQRHGNHTWDLVVHYYRCPQCGYIAENRDKFEARFNRLEKDLVCLRCQYAFTIAKKTHPAFGPLLGHNPEVDE